jgi:hypothetical protein|tara:strand:- start:1270 stop:1419 length:150 start_codon:yes stop_codon:yes gene_type:complete
MLHIPPHGITAAYNAPCITTTLLPRNENKYQYYQIANKKQGTPKDALLM